MGESSKSITSLDEQVIIVLHIKEGVGFNSADKVLIQASLNANKLESAPIRPGHTTLFSTDLIWETDRKAIKRMKTENLPVKVDCFGLKRMKGDKTEAAKEHIGYIILPVKNIPIVPLPKALQMKPRWSKVIGLSKDWRPHKPELLLNLMITSRDFLNCDKDDRPVEDFDEVVIEENPMPCMLTSQQDIFIRLLKEEGLLQVGNIDTSCDVFNIKIVLRNVHNLESLANQAAGDSIQKFHLNYMLMGNKHTRQLDQKFNCLHQIQEKVLIKYRSSLGSLKEYLEKVFYIPLEVTSGEQVLGVAVIKLDQLIPTTDLTEFLEMNQAAVYVMDGTCDVKPSQALPPGSSQPKVEFTATLQYVATKKLHQTELLQIYKRQQDVESQAGGDSLQDLPVSVKSSALQVRHMQAVPSEVKTVGVGQQAPVKPSDPQSNKIDVESILTEQGGSIAELPRLFSFNICVTSIEFQQKPEKGVWQLSFSHDKADKQRVIVNHEISHIDGTTIDFNLTLKLLFTSRTNEVLELVQSSEHSMLRVQGPRGMLAKGWMDNKSLLIGSKEKMCGIVQLLNQADELMAMAKISLSLDDLSINFSSQVKPTVSTAILELLESRTSEINIARTLEGQKAMLHDENLSYKMIQELEEWKTAQQETFIADLKKKEVTYIERLRTTWNQKKTACEQDLVMKADKLHNLTQSLQEAKKDIEEGKNSRDEERMRKYKTEVEKMYSDQLMAIRERARRMEKDLLHGMKLKDIRFEDVERANHHLKEENCELRRKVECLQAEIEDLKVHMVPKHEVEKLAQEAKFLKEKCESIQQSKLYYKEEWAKAYRECHKVRRENLESARDEIFNSKYDRLCDVLDEDHCQLNFDKHELDEIKHCLNLTDDEF